MYEFPRSDRILQPHRNLLGRPFLQQLLNRHSTSAERPLQTLQISRHRRCKCRRAGFFQCHPSTLAFFPYRTRLRPCKLADSIDCCDSRCACAASAVSNRSVRLFCILPMRSFKVAI